MTKPIPIFPLAGTILLPDQLLPLNLFEPRYVAMGKYAFENRLPIGMIQPIEAGGALFELGCAGEIVHYEESPDGRIELALKGTQMFTVKEELPLHKDGFRLIEANWQDTQAPEESSISSSEVVFATRRLMEALNMKIAVDELESITGEELVDVLSMLIPFPPEDKQAILEATNASARFELLKHLTQAYSNTSTAGSQAVH